MKDTVIYKRWFATVIVAFLLTAAGAFTFGENLILSIFIMIIGIFLIVGNIFLMPVACKINETGITVYYCFGLTVAEWEDIKDIHTGISPSFGNCFPLTDYEIGYFKTKNPFLQQASVPKNRKTTKLLKKYSKIPIK